MHDSSNGTSNPSSSNSRHRVSRTTSDARPGQQFSSCRPAPLTAAPQLASHPTSPTGADTQNHNSSENQQPARLPSEAAADAYYEHWASNPDRQGASHAADSHPVAPTLGSGSQSPDSGEWHNRDDIPSEAAADAYYEERANHPGHGGARRTGDRSKL